MEKKSAHAIFYVCICVCVKMKILWEKVSLQLQGKHYNAKKKRNKFDLYV